MAGELECVHTTGRTVYFQVRNSSGLIFNTASGLYEAYLTANIADYDVAATEQGTASGVYVASIPAGISSGLLNIVAKDRAGGAPAETDLTIATGEVNWSGSIVPFLPGLANFFTASAGTYATADALSVVAQIVDSVTANGPTDATIADKLLGRNLAGGSDGGRMVKDALRAARNKVAFDVPIAGQFTVFAEDDVTPAWTGTYTTAAGNPVTVMDPA